MAGRGPAGAGPVTDIGRRLMTGARLRDDERRTPQECPGPERVVVVVRPYV